MKNALLCILPKTSVSVTPTRNVLSVPYAVSESAEVSELPEGAFARLFETNFFIKGIFIKIAVIVFVLAGISFVVKIAGWVS